MTGGGFCDIVAFSMKYADAGHPGKEENDMRNMIVLKFVDRQGRLSYDLCREHGLFGVQTCKMAFWDLSCDDWEFSDF